MSEGVVPRPFDYSPPREVHALPNTCRIRLRHNPRRSINCIVARSVVIIFYQRRRAVLKLHRPSARFGYISGCPCCNFPRRLCGMFRAKSISLRFLLGDLVILVLCILQRHAIRALPSGIMGTAAYRPNPLLKSSYVSVRLIFGDLSIGIKGHTNLPKAVSSEAANRMLAPRRNN